MSAHRVRALALALALVAAVVATYREVGGFAFVRYDDPDYVTENPHVRAGLTAEGARWALASAHASNWHPLTWLSHMLDVELFELVPAWHHWTAVGLHALAALLCFAAFARLTGRVAASAWVAFLFALHPLRVESVAWVSERKDVLSGCAFFALLWAYAGYARRGGVARYVLVALCFALGLAAKPMLVTAPFVLLLLDLWPLSRWTLRGVSPASDPAGGGPPGALPLSPPGAPSLAPTLPGERATGPARRSRYGVLIEKLPLLALAALASAAAVWSQRLGGSLHSIESIPLDARLANAPVAVVRYVAHLVWPARLAYFYPHPALVAERASAWTPAALGALAAVLAVTALVLRAARRAPEVAVGWLWFLGMLVPVIGVVQVGEQALADRYAYLPAVGLQLALVFALDRCVRGARTRRALAAAGTVALVALSLRSTDQARAWHDSEALFRHALAVTERNYPAWVGLANEHAARGELAEARRGYDEALAIRPDYAPGLYGLGLFAQTAGDAERALALYDRALLAQPGLAAAHLNRGTLLAGRGDRVGAAEAFERVLALFPEHPDAHYDLALLLVTAGELDAAREHLARALAARPEQPGGWTLLGDLEERAGDHPAALAALARAEAADPADARALRLAAWILATAAEAEIRDPARALDLARRAVALTARRDPAALEALAAALAATGDFPRATEVQREALALLPPGQQGAARARLVGYERGVPFVHEH